MKFISLEDPKEIFKVTLFQKIYQKRGHLLEAKGPFVVKGKGRQWKLDSKRTMACPSQKSIYREGVVEKV